LVQVRSARCRDASWVTWSVEHLSLCGTIDDPLGLGLVVWNGLRYGSNDCHVIAEFGDPRIKFLTDEFGFFGVIIAGKSYSKAVSEMVT